MINEQIVGKVVDVSEDGKATIIASLPSINRAMLRNYSECTVCLNDGRRISARQRRAIYALLGEIDEYVNGVRTAEGIEEQKRLLKLDFMLKRMNGVERQLFSLSDTDVTTAREFIAYIVDFIIANDIPTQIPLREQCEDIAQYTYACLMHKRCAICGKHSDLHHVDSVGMGNDREQVHHLGRLALPLCREHHTELHTMGNEAFMRRYHIEPVKIDARICKTYGLKK